MKSSRKSEYSVEKLASTATFTTLQQLLGEIKVSLNVTPNQVGYIEPGHGLKGKQRWLTSDADLTEMYTIYDKKKEILLWCQCFHGKNKPNPKKRGREDGADDERMLSTSSSKKADIKKKIEDVEVIVKELEEKNSALLSAEQYNAWAHLIHTKKYASYDVPPKLPYFKKTKGQSSRAPDSVERPKTPIESGSVRVSPRKRVNLRGECISQLDQWHSLLKKECITQEQYDQLRETILKDAFNF